MISSIRARYRRLVSPSTSPPFPYKQMFVLALCRLCEPVAFMSIFPYVHSMMKDYGITQEKDIAIYASMVTSSFAFAEFSSGYFWGRMSDRVGRKPVLLMGMFGTGLSMIILGFAPNLWIALLARALGGLLNGNIGVIQTTVAETVTLESQRPRAFSIVPSVWSIGSIIGAYLGGTFSNPVNEYPDYFHPGTIWQKYPYLLPNLICVAFVFFGLVVGVLFLEETHEEIKQQGPDFGLRLGQSMLRRFARRTTYPNEKLAVIDEQSPLHLSHHRAGTSTYGATTEIQSVTLIPEDALAKRSAENETPTPASVGILQAFTPQIILTVVATGILAFHTISLDQQLPLLMAAPSPTQPPRLPFKFEVGLELTDQRIGSILSMQGVMQIFTQLIMFPHINRRLGSLWTFRMAIVIYPILYFLVPYVALLPSNLQIPSIYGILAWKIVGQSLTYPSAAMIVSSLAPKSGLGSIMGVYSSSQSLSRGIGPIISGAIQSYGTMTGYAGLMWWVCSMVATVGLIESFFMKGQKYSPKDIEHAQPMTEPSQQRLLGAMDDDDETTVGDYSDEEDGTLCGSPRTGSMDSKRLSIDSLEHFSDHDALLQK